MARVTIEKEVGIIPTGDLSLQEQQGSGEGDLFGR